MTDPFVSVARQAVYGDAEVPESVPRDRWGRPLILQLDGSLEPYTRISTAAGWLEDGHGLGIWKTRHVALAIARDEAVAGVVAAMEYGDAGLDELIDRALDRSGGSDAALHGTAIHAWTEHRCDCPARGAMPKRHADDVLSYDDAMAAAGLTLVESEVFVVDDRRKVAGTLDGIWRDSDGNHYVGDKKTGKERPLRLAAQLGMYSDGERYDPATGERSRLLPDGIWPCGEALGISIPRGEGRTVISRVVLDSQPAFVVRGKASVMGACEIADLAVEVGRARKMAKDIFAPW
jgi:hypothetical protein